MRLEDDFRYKNEGILREIGNLKSEIDALYVSLKEKNIEFQELKAENAFFVEQNQQNLLELGQISKEIGAFSQEFLEISEENRQISSFSEEISKEKQRIAVEIASLSREIDDFQENNAQLERKLRLLEETNAELEETQRNSLQKLEKVRKTPDFFEFSGK